MRLILALVIFFFTSTTTFGQDLRCGVRLIFGSDQKGSIANYVLSLQLKNTTGRNIAGASILYKDSSGNVLGNTFLECKVLDELVKPGSYGDCKTVIQSVDGQYVKSFGLSKWTEIVNTQLALMRSVQFCQLLGFSF